MFRPTCKCYYLIYSSLPNAPGWGPIYWSSSLVFHLEDDAKLVELKDNFFNVLYTQGRRDEEDDPNKPALYQIRANQSRICRRVVQASYKTMTLLLVVMSTC